MLDSSPFLCRSQKNDPNPEVCDPLQHHSPSNQTHQHKWPLIIIIHHVEHEGNKPPPLPPPRGWTCVWAHLHDVIFMLEDLSLVKHTDSSILYWLHEGEEGGGCSYVTVTRSHCSTSLGESQSLHGWEERALFQCWMDASWNMWHAVKSNCWVIF